MEYPEYDTEHFVRDLTTDQLINLRDILYAYDNDIEKFGYSLYGEVLEEIDNREYEGSNCPCCGEPY